MRLGTSEPEPGPALRRAVANVADALGSPVRVAIVERLAQRPHFVHELAEALGQSVANTSQHLQRLSRVGLVVRDREGTRVRYALAGDDVARLWTTLYGVAARHDASVDGIHRTWQRRRRVPPALSAPEVRALLRSCGPLVVDVRPAEEYAAGHVEGAISAPFDRLDDPHLALPIDRPLLLHCRGPACTFAAEAAARLRGRGYEAHWTDLAPHDLRSMLEADA